MDDCCNAKQSDLAALAERQSRVLKWVLGINLLMFFVEGAAGIIARSTSLLADSLDMLGDACVYAISLYAIGRGARWTGSVSFLKGLLMGLFGLGTVGKAIYEFLSPSMPVVVLMGTAGGLALLANIVCALLLLRHREDDINMRSTWLCSRNDVIANIGVLAAAGAVSLTGSKYPDLVVGFLIAGLVIRSSISVLRESSASLRMPDHSRT